MYVDGKVKVYRSGNTRKLPKSRVGRIGIGRKGGIPKLLITSGPKPDEYPLEPNRIRRLHSNFVKDGKGTIELSEPDIMIEICNANHSRLHKLFRLLGNLMNGAEFSSVEVELETAGPLQLRDRDDQDTMTITSKESYPKKGFPKLLSTLAISANMCRVDAQWFVLKYLVSLNLMNNRLGKMDDFDWRKFNNISKLSALKTLKLDNNQITTIPEDFMAAIPKSLNVLTLGNNEIIELPETLCELSSLTTFDIRNNPIADLPEDFFYFCRKLKSFNCSGTNIRSHPASFRNLKLLYLETSAANATFVQVPVFGGSPLTLVALTAAKVYDDKENFLRIPAVVRHNIRSQLFRCDRCAQLRPMFYLKERSVQPIPATAISVEVVGSGHRNHVPLLDNTCSFCYQKTVHGEFLY